MTKQKKRGLAIGLCAAAVVIAVAVYLIYGATALINVNSVDSIRSHLAPNRLGECAVLADETSGRNRAVLFSGPGQDELVLAVFQKHPLYPNRYKVVTQMHGDTAYFSEKIKYCAVPLKRIADEEKMLCFAGTGEQDGTYSLFESTYYGTEVVGKLGTITVPDGAFVQFQTYTLQNGEDTVFYRSGDLTAEQAAADRAAGVQDDT